MFGDSSYIMYQKKNIIQISKNLLSPNIEIPISSPKNYSLKQNSFDPLKNSPPNDFMIKLHKRMNLYNNSLGINDDK